MLCSCLVQQNLIMFLYVSLTYKYNVPFTTADPLSVLCEGAGRKMAQWEREDFTSCSS